MFNYYNLNSNFSPDEVLIYLRKSRSDDPILTVEEVLQKHETMLDEWTEKYLDGAIPESNRFREVVSGETIAARPEIQKLLKLIESPKYKAILIVDIQRLSRGDLEDAGRLIKLLRFTNTFVITPQKTYDLQNDFDRDYFERELKRGNEFLEYTKKIMNNGRLLSVSQGNYIGSKPPYGYDKVWITEGKRKCPTLAENKEQADVVRTIFDLYVNNDMGITNICHKLDSLGVKPPIGEHWSTAAVREMLVNVHYIGKVKWNWRKAVISVEDGEIVKMRPKHKNGDYLIYDGKHDGIISEEIFNAAQEKKGRNHRAKPSTTLKNPLASLVYCQCGRAMTLRTYKDKDGNERCAPRLGCDNQVHCGTGSCLFSDLIDRVCFVLQKTIADFEVKLSNNTSDSVELQKKIIKQLEKKLKEISEKEVSQWEAQAHPDPTQRMPADIFKILNEKLLKEKADTQQALQTAVETMPTPSEYEEKIKRFSQALEALKNPEVDAAYKNKLLKNCIERIEYRREAPKRLKRAKDEKKGSTFKKSGGYWSDPPIELDVKLKI